MKTGAGTGLPSLLTFGDGNYPDLLLKAVPEAWLASGTPGPVFGRGGPLPGLRFPELGSFDEEVGQDCDLWSDLTAGSWPEQDSDMPRIGRPAELDFGRTGDGSDFVRDGTDQVVFSMNRRFVYQTVLGATGSVVRRRFRVPRCWSLSQIAVQSEPEIPPEDLDRVLRHGTVVSTPLRLVEDDGTEVVVCPFGIAGKYGLARVTLPQGVSPGGIGPDRWTAGVATQTTREFDRPWTLHLADVASGIRDISTRQDKVSIAATSDFVFVTMGAFGVAMYRRAGSTYPYVGQLPLPQWDARNLNCYGLTTFERESVDWVGIAASPQQAGSAPQLPRAILVPVGPGGVLTTFSPLLVLRSVDEDHRATWGIDVASVRPALVGPTSFILAVTTDYTVDVWDITEQLNPLAPHEHLVSDTDAFDLLPALVEYAAGFPFRVVALAVGEDEHLDGFGLSAGDDTGCGPPALSPAASDYSNLKQIGIRVRPTFAPPYLLLGSRAAAPTEPVNDFETPAEVI